MSSSQSSARLPDVNLHQIAQAMCFAEHGDLRYDPGNPKHDKWLERARQFATVARVERERFHVLSTVIAYPFMSTADVLDRANNECQHDLFDPLPTITPQGMAAKLKRLQAMGLVAHWRDFDCDRWDPTDAGREAWTAYKAVLGA